MSCRWLIAADPPSTIPAFVATYCVECHGAKEQKGERRFDTLSLPAARPDALIDLQDMIDQLNLGQMPPKEAQQPSAEERRAAVALLTKAVTKGRSNLRSTGGQTVLRRLNRREYLNTVGDLLALNMTMFDPTTSFPQDQTAEHFDNLGDVLQTSGYLLAQYLDAADQVVEKALSNTERPAEQSWTFNGNFRQQQELRHPHGKVFNYRYLCLYEVPDTVNHEGGYGPIHDFQDGVPADGYYEIRVQAQAMNRLHPYDPNIFKRVTEQPFRLGIVPGNAKAGPLHHPQPIEPQLAEVTVQDGDPQWHTMTVWLDAGFTPRFTFPNGMANSRRAFGQILARHRNLLPEEVRDTRGIFETRPVILKHGWMPHIRIHEIQIRGPLIDQWPPKSEQIVLGDQPFAPQRTREILERFASRAYRREARSDEIDRLMKVVEHRRAAGRSPFEAMKDGLKAILCSPAFLYLVEPAEHDQRELSPHALATRLSYFLWATMPDDELRSLADSGELVRAEVLRKQTHRLLASPRSNDFVAGFLDTWLNLRSLGDMPPDRDAFDRYYYQDLQSAMKQETQLFARHLLDTDGSILDFLDADYTFVNQPLASLYGIAFDASPETAHHFRRVKLADRQRGGLLGQASVLTVSANGIETSPVTRGVWLLENILGTPPAPPPDNVPPIDPDIRGAKSMRDILTKHRDNPGCYDCHRKIDPLGFALENFDPIGAWRTHYDKNQLIDAAGELPSGETFRDIGDLKQILLKRREPLARMLTEKLLSYACGRRLEISDRQQVDQIVRDLARHNYGFRRLVELVVLSETFRTK